MSKLAQNRLNSTWTPLNNDEINEKIFNERRNLVVKWFDKCNDVQRLAILQELVSQSTGRQLELVAASVARRKPIVYDDFTRFFPRILSIYLFSFLDPRSLCRCAQVSWHWKSLVEVDQLWINKCLRLGWMLTFTPSQHETGMWKRLYIEHILALKQTCAVQNQKSTTATKASAEATVNDHMNHARSGMVVTASGKRPPWKGSDPAPRDTWRNNYLDNEDEVEKVNRLRKRGLYGTEAVELTRRAKNKVDTGRHSARQRTNSLTRSPSAIPPSVSAQRPAWATAVVDSIEVNQSNSLQSLQRF